MSVVPAESAPIAPPIPDIPAPEGEVTPDVIAAFNKRVESEYSSSAPVDISIGEGLAVSATPIPGTTLNADTPEPIDHTYTPEPEAPPVEVEEAKDLPDDTETTTDVTETTVESPYKLGTDVPIEEFVEQKAAYLKTVEITPELQSILDRQEAEITAAKGVVAEMDNIANKDTLVKIGSAMNRLFETEIVEGGQVKVNAEPLVSLLRTDFKDEFRTIAEEILATDSAKHVGVSMLGEILIDNFGPEKAHKMLAYAQTDIPLPVVPSTLRLPQGLDEKNKDAYWKLSEVKRFQIEGLVDDINEFQKELARDDNSEWRKEDIAKEMREKKELLDTEFYAIDQIQRGIDGDRNNKATRERQEQEAAVNFRNKVNVAYNTELFELDEALNADLAPRLSYADTDTQLPHARDITARIKSALGFTINPDGSISNDPMADRYAKQLAEEGIKFDFVNGRDLLKKHYKSKELLTALHERNASEPHINKAKHDHNKILLDLKMERKSLVGQLSTKYVKSSGAALDKQIKAVRDKKQAVKTITNGKPHTDRGPDSPEKLARDLAEYNRKVAAATGDDLYNQYQ